MASGSKCKGERNHRGQDCPRVIHDRLHKFHQKTFGRGGNANPTLNLIRCLHMLAGDDVPNRKWMKLDRCCTVADG